jgi:hypothetical protein
VRNRKLISICVLATAGVLMWGSARALAQTLPDGWSTTDIGNVGAAGSANGADGSFTVTGSGADIWGTVDAFRFAYRPFSGDGSIVARVTSVDWVNDWTKAGVMMRETLATNARHALMLVSANKGLAFQRRPTAGGTSLSTSGGAGNAPYWIRLARNGNTFTGDVSLDGTTWTTVGSQTIAMAATIYVGLAVTSHDYGKRAAATFASTTVNGGAVGSTPTTETLVFFRHGEKPSGGYGQITCQGLQRALALPDVLVRMFGVPNQLFAPNPTPKIVDAAGAFDYVRPLATIEPTAIRLGLPVNATLGYNDLSGLQNALLAPSLASATVFIAWEHLKLQQFVQNLMNSYGGGQAVPSWPSGDYDSIYVVRLTNNGGAITAQFEHTFQGLNGMPTTCP